MQHKTVLRGPLLPILDLTPLPFKPNSLVYIYITQQTPTHAQKQKTCLGMFSLSTNEYLLLKITTFAVFACLPFTRTITSGITPLSCCGHLFTQLFPNFHSGLLEVHIVFTFPFFPPLAPRISSHLLENLQRPLPFPGLFAGADGGVEADAVAFDARALERLKQP